MLDKKWEASVLKVNGASVGPKAYISCDDACIAIVNAPSMFGSDEGLREIALEYAEHITQLHNDEIKRKAR